MKDKIIIKNDNAIEYMGNHAERLEHASELQYGELYVIGRGSKGFLGFRMPGEKQVERSDEGSVNLKGVVLYEAALDEKKELVDQRVEKNSSLHIDEFMDFEIMGVLRPTEGSRLRRTLEKGLAEDSPLRKAAE